MGEGAVWGRVSGTVRFGIKFWSECTLLISRWVLVADFGLGMVSLYCAAGLKVDVLKWLN